MNRLVPSRPPLARVRRHVGALPHGLPTALLFTAAVGALMLGSFVVVDRALPVLMRPDAADVRVDSEPTTAMPLPVAFRAVEPEATTAASPATASPRPDPTTSPQTGERRRPEVAAGRPPRARSSGRTVSFRRGAESPNPTPVLDGDRLDRATPEPSPSQPGTHHQEDERGPAPTPTFTAVAENRLAPTSTFTAETENRPAPTPSPTPRHTSRRSPAPNTPEPTETPEWSTPEPED